MLSRGRFFFCQRAGEGIASTLPAFSGATRLFDRGPPAVFDLSGKVAETTSKAFYVYVDNIGLITTKTADARADLASVASAFTAQGLLTHEEETTTGETKALGTRLDLRRLEASLTPKRVWKVMLGVRAALRAGRLSGRVVEILVGHLTFCGLLDRASLSCLSSCYAFARRHYLERRPLWTQARAELLHMANLLPYLRASWTQGWSEIVTCTDASESGYGAVTSAWRTDDVAKVGRVPERSRFRKREGHSARDAFFKAAGYCRGSDGLWAEGDAPEEKELWETVAGFPEIDAKLITQPAWDDLIHGPWRYFDESIVVLEARALLRGFQAAVSKYDMKNCRALVIVDNMSVCLCFVRRRSRDQKILRCVRILSAWTLARNIKLSIRWAPSEVNPSDESSRLYDKLAPTVPKLEATWSRIRPNEVSHPCPSSRMESFVSSARGQRRQRVPQRPDGREL